MNDELSQLKERADQLGIQYKANIGVEALKAKVNAALNDTPAPANEDSDPVSNDPAEAKAPAKGETTQQLRDRLIKEATALVRCRITCMNPAKQHMHGEVITVGNKFTGAISKFVSYGEDTDNGYHIPKIIYDELKQRKFNSVRAVKGPNGMMTPVQRLVPEFAIEVLPALTKDELATLARSQAAKAGL